MNTKMIGAALATAALVSLPLAACGSSSTLPATTVTATATAPSSTSSSSCTISGGYENWESCWRAEQRQHPTTTTATPTAAPAKSGGGLPWWSWLLIVPAGLGLLAFLGFKGLEANDERTISRAQARVAELDARVARRATRVLDYDDYEDDDEADELDELPEDAMEFLRKATHPSPAPAQPAPPAGGNLLSSLRQQSQ